MSSAWDTSRPDWQDRIRQGKSLLPDLPLIDGEAARALAIFDRLRLPDVPGQPPMAEAAGQWQRDLVRAIYGSYDPETKIRHITEFFAMVPKKSSKTTLGAAIMVVALLLNRRPRAEFLLIAPTILISDTAFRQAVGMIEADEVLRQKFQIQEHIKRITYRPTKAFLMVKSFDPKVITGTKPSGVLIDELHVMSSDNNADRVIGQLRGGLLPNPEAFLITITTQSEREPAGVFKAALEKARKVRDGELSLSLLPMLYEFPPGVDWKDSENWWMVTPNNGRSVTINGLREYYQTALAEGEKELRRWASQHLNIQIGMALRTDMWPGAEYWQRRADPTLTLDEIIDRSEIIVVGVDGGGLDDLFGLAVLGRDKETKDWMLWPYAWGHQIVLERRRSIVPRLKDFERAGEMTIIDDRLDDIREIVDIVQRIKDEEKLAAVAVDPAGLGEFVDAMATIEVTQENGLLVGIGQGYRLMNAIKTGERMLASGRLRHNGSSMMAWCVGNLRIEPTATAIRATKQNAGDDKIDPAMAMFNAIDVMSLNPAAKTSKAQIWVFA